MYYEFIQKHKRLAQLAVVLFVLLVIGWAVSTYIDHYGKQLVVIAAVPSDANIQFNGKSYGDGTHYIPAGTYIVTAMKNGYEKVTKKVLVTDKKSQNVVAISLNPQSDEAKKWANTHASDYQKNETYGAIEASSNGQYFSNLHPITTKLPYTDPYFTIAYVTNSNDDSITLTILTPSPRYRFYAVAKIRELGYDPTDYKIDFKDFKNPLLSEATK